MRKTVAVYCASSNQLAEPFVEGARALGVGLAAHGHDVIYGGTDVGTMGAMAYAAQAAGSHVTGVITSYFVENGFRYQDADEVIVTESLAERKEVMEERANAFVILPGGYGTLDEFMQVVTLKILHYHDKPIVLLNLEGAYDSLLALCREWEEKGFARPVYRAAFEVATTVEEALAILNRELGRSEP